MRLQSALRRWSTAFLAAAMTFSIPAFAGVIASDNFSVPPYKLGTLGGQTAGGSGFAGTWTLVSGLTQDLSVNTGNVIGRPAVASGSAGDSIKLATPLTLTSGQLYISYMMVNLGTANLSSTRLDLNFSTSSPFVGYRALLGGSGSASPFNFYLEGGLVSGGAALTAQTSIPSTGTHTIVGVLDWSNKKIAIFVDPGSGSYYSSNGANNATATAAWTPASGLVWSGYSLVENTGDKVNFDNVVFATDPASAGLAAQATTCTYSFSASTAMFTATGGTGTVNITTQPGCVWGAVPSVSWITSTSIGTGSGTISYTVAANTGTTVRTGTITAGGQTLTISQAPPAACTYSLSTSTASATSAGGSGSFSVNTAAGCAWAATSAVSWITTTSSGTGSGTVNYSVAANTSTASRTGTIAVADQTFTLTQAAVSATFTVPSITSGGVVNAADYTAAIAPGGMVAVFGQNFTTQTTVASSVPLPTSLAGVSVTVTDATGAATNVPLYFISAQQINFQMPFSTASVNLNVTVTNPAGTSSAEPILLATVAPRIFVGPIAGQTLPILLHAADYSFVTPTSPAMPGEYLVLLLTGLGAVNPQGTAGAAGGDNASNGPLNLVVAPVSVTFGGFSATAAFAGLMPGFAGVYQVNFQVPAGLTPGTYPLSVQAGSAASQLNVVSLVGTKLPLAGSTMISSSGGIVTGGGLTMNVPAGMVSASTPVSIYMDSSKMSPANGMLSPSYLLTGIPAVNSAAVPGTITLSSAPVGSVLLAVTMNPSFEGGSGTTYLPAQVQGSQVIFTLPATSDTPNTFTASSAPGGRPVPALMETTEEQNAILQVTSKEGTVMSPGGKAEVNYSGLTQATAAALAPFFDEAVAKQTALGLDWTWRALPVEVYAEIFGSGDADKFGYESASVFGPNYAAVHLNSVQINNEGVGEDYHATCGHEIFHVLQEHYDPRGNYAKASGPGTWLWFHEALSTWFEGFMVNDPKYVSATIPADNYRFFSARGLEFGDGGASEQQEHGYGASMFLTYLTTEHNDNTIPAKILKLEAGQNPPIPATQAIGQVLGGLANLNTEWKGFLEAWMAPALFAGTFPTTQTLAITAKTYGTRQFLKTESDTGFTQTWYAPPLSGHFYTIEWQKSTTWKAGTNNMTLKLSDPAGLSEALVYVSGATEWRLLTRLAPNTPYQITNAEQFVLNNETLAILVINGTSALTSAPSTYVTFATTVQPATVTPPPTNTVTQATLAKVNFSANAIDFGCSVDAVGVQNAPMTIGVVGPLSWSGYSFSYNASDGSVKLAGSYDPTSNSLPSVTWHGVMIIEDDAAPYHLQLTITEDITFSKMPSAGAVSQGGVFYVEGSAAAAVVQYKGTLAVYDNDLGKTTRTCTAAVSGITDALVQLGVKTTTFF